VKRTIAPLAVLLVAIAVAVVALLATGGRHGGPAASVPAGSAPLHGTGFDAAYPATWSATARSGPHDSAQYRLSSTGAPVNGLGIAPAGTAGITITDIPARGESRGRAFDEEHVPAASLLRLLVGTPRVATGVTRPVAPRPTQLAGVEAAEEAYAYHYEGRQILQVDVVAAHGGRMVMLELDTEPSLAGNSQTALTQLAGNWHWR